MANESHLLSIKSIMFWCNIFSFIGVLLLTIDYFRKSRSKKAKKMGLALRITAIGMFMGTTLSLFCKIVLPYAVNCQWQQRITVFWYTIIRNSYYLFLCYRLEFAFCNSLVDPMPKKPISVFRWVVTANSVLIGTWNIATVTTITEIDISPFGLYCELLTPKANIMYYAGTDLIICVIMVYMFVSKLYSVNRFFTKMAADSAGDTGPANSKILERIKILTTLTVISVASTWVFIIGGYTVFPFMSWTVTADYFINVCCLYLMFGFVKLRERLSVARSIKCPGSTYCCWCWCCPGFKHICWKEDTRVLMASVEGEISQSSRSGKEPSNFSLSSTTKFSKTKTKNSKANQVHAVSRMISNSAVSSGSDDMPSPSIDCVPSNDAATQNKSELNIV
eukprot:246506_1